MKAESELAILGGKPVRQEPFPDYNTIGEEEIQRALDVLKTGVLSGFVASPNKYYYGGEWTQELERAFCETFHSQYATAFNSATSGLHAALVAVGVKEGDEVIVSPYTMSASATSTIMCGAQPIFVDVEEDTFCLKFEEVEKAITNKTKAIMAVNIFGQAADLERLRDLARKENIKLIEDNAQAPAATLNGKYTGTFGDLAVFSLNRHKTMQCGEGGVVICNDENLQKRLQMVRNHGEVVLMDWPEVLGGYGNEDVVGFNYRLTELQCAIAIPQVKRIKKLNETRVKLANYLAEKLQEFPFLKAPEIRKKATHVYYLFPMLYDASFLGINRDQFVEALKAEGMPVSNYVKPLYHIPLYHHRFANEERYNPERFPVVENLFNAKMIVTPICRPPLSKEDIDQFISAIRKVSENITDLKD